MAKKLLAVHPGEILSEEFLKPYSLTQYRLAKDIGVPPIRINQIIHGMRCITADTALRLSRYFKTTPEFWLNLQAHYDLEEQRQSLSQQWYAAVKIFKPVQATV